ncbi:MAG: PA domain-containing protein, partial [bacterium]
MRQIIMKFWVIGFLSCVTGITLAQEISKIDQLIRQAQSAVTPGNLRGMLRTLTEEPHVAGTPADFKTAEYVRDKLKSWGWAAELVEYEVLLNYPQAALDPVTGRRNPSLEIIRPNAMPLAVTEVAWPGDKDSASPDAFPAFNGYGASGVAEGQVVYANYGRPEDFETLAGMGVEVRDRIVLVRYGKLFRGLKVREAQKRGARG